MKKRFAAALIGAVAALSSAAGAPGASAAEPVAGSSFSSSLPALVTHVGDTPQYRAIIPAARPLPMPDPVRVALGRQLFLDTRLSQPQGTSCASCHDPARAFTGFNGGRDGVARGAIHSRLGTRNPPSLTYVRYLPALYFYQDDDAQVPSPFGGLMLDGRADDVPTQMREPLLARHEMNMGNNRAVAARLQASGYQQAFEGLYGKDVLRDPQRAVQALGRSLEAYLQSDELSPFSSRFDDMLRGQGTLNAQEMRGLAVFRNPDQGNCASCHVVSVTSGNPARSLFTDFGYDAIGVPRNRKLPSNADPRAYDLGLCRTAEQRHWPEAESWCGYFRTPSLRNVAARQRFMHNGVFDSLRDAVRFYATRSTSPADWYGKGPAFDDIPAAMRGNINTVANPFSRRAGTQPAMTEQDIDDVVAFLDTLTDRPFRK
ncbi:MAG: cytochrome c peroxidase [Pseudomonadota bacterium]